MLEADRSELGQLVERILDAEPGWLAVMLFGSHARGGAGPFSDIDVRVFTAGAPRQRDRVQITASAGRLLHWSIGSRSLAEKLQELTDPDLWAWAAAHYRDMQPLRDPHRLLPLLRAAVAHTRPQPAAYAASCGYDLESLLEYHAKVKNAALTGTLAEATLAAVPLVHFCEKLLRPLNPLGIFASEPAMDAYYRDLPVAPDGWAKDRAVCLGGTGAARTLPDLLAASRRLAAGTVAMVRVHMDQLPFPDDVAALLRDGVIDGYLAREV